MGAREGTTTYTYGTLGELKSVVKPDGTVIRYYQNADHQRVAKEIDGTIVEKYLWEDLTTLLAVYKVNGEAREGALGYGTLWGGEVLLADLHDYKRVHHLKPFRLLGGAKAVKEPRRVALSLLFECYTLEEILSLESETTRSFTADEIKSLYTMWQKGLNSPYTTSLGRVFDAVASLAGVAQILGYEGESGLLLESLIEDEIDLDKKFSYTIEDDSIDISAMVKEILHVKDPATISSMFISMVVHIILDTVGRYPSLPVILSGGVFQNRVLVDKLVKEFKKRKIRYYIQKDTPVNDGSIALGQAYYAVNRQWGESGR